jgi:hypothetical protein
MKVEIFVSYRKLYLLTKSVLEDSSFWFLALSMENNLTFAPNNHDPIGWDTHQSLNSYVQMILLTIFHAHFISLEETKYKSMWYSPSSLPYTWQSYTTCFCIKKCNDSRHLLQTKHKVHFLFRINISNSVCRKYKWFNNYSFARTKQSFMMQKY